MDTDLLYPPAAVTPDVGQAFEQLFKSHFKALYGYAFTILNDDVMAEEVVQNVFCRMWEKREQIAINQSAKAYLYRSVYNESLNYLKHQRVKAAYQQHAARNTDTAEHAAAQMSHSQLQQQLAKALNELPEQCRAIFQKSRFEELKYREIADEMGLSIKTVENQMGKALKILRSKLIDFLPAFIFSLLNL
jgi:RNA polymerase sigma-70 factor (ECF subfamily)